MTEFSASPGDGRLLMKEKEQGTAMINLRFRYVVVRSLFSGFLYMLPKANYMISHRERYSEKERFDFACRIMDFMRRKSRTVTKVYGRENLPKEGNYILYANHQGKYDALGILLALDEPCGVLWEKKQAQRIMSRQVCGLIGGVPIDLTDMRAKMKAITRVTEQIKAGRNMLIFPEGGYKDNGNRLQEFQFGCFHCALRSGATIVPVTLYDSYRALNSNTFERVTTQVHFLKPIPYAEYGKLSKQEISELVKGRIAEKLEEIRAQKAGKPVKLP